jgi:regulator of sigma E protease
VDEARYLPWRIAGRALEAGRSLPAALNAANEVAVAAFWGADRFCRYLGAVDGTQRHQAGEAERWKLVLAVDRRRGGDREFLAKGLRDGQVFGTILSFVVVFGVLVFIHEFGHFFTAKLVGIRVETFSFGYGKRLFGIRRKETDYRVSLIPMGGYVKFLGEGEFFSEGGKISLPPDHFLAKTRWERFLVMVMGSVMNIFLALLIATVINMVGVNVPAYQDEKPVIGYIEPGSPAEKAGFRLDDEILGVDDERVRTWIDVELAVGSKPDRWITVEIRREGEVLEIPLRTEKITRYALGYAGFTGQFLTQIRLVNPGFRHSWRGCGGRYHPGCRRPDDLSHSSSNTREEPQIARSSFATGRNLQLRVAPARGGEIGSVRRSIEERKWFVGPRRACGTTSRTRS